ncbi:PucR family transcriptional regulator [Nocardia sp. NPDC020380]|uniref:PucR family transcriptional regulator n=1 Tax=Nocardia sp. NPDC020380 TaxID=3364309 RepID=UPI0037ACDD38
MSSDSSGRSKLVAAVWGDPEALLARAFDRMRAELPSYARLELTELVPYGQRTLAPLMEAITEARAFTDAEVAILVAHGHARGRQGIPVTDMFQGWRLTIRGIAEDTVTRGRSAGFSDSELLELNNDLVEITDAAILAMARGHHAAELELTRHDQQHRADVVRGVLFGTLTPAETRIEVERFGLDADREYRALRARPNAEFPADRLILRLEQAPDGTRPRSLLAIIDGDIAGFADTAPPGDIAAAIGIGPAARPDRMEPSFRSATRAMTTADAFGRTGVHDMSSLGLLPAVLADSEVGTEILRRYVTPLGDNDSAAAMLDTLRHYMRNGLRIDHTAEAMHLHTNTIRYRLRRYQDLLGIDLTDPPQLLEAWWAVQRLTVQHPE